MHQNAQQEISQFVADLFGEPIASFSPIIASPPPPVLSHTPSLQELDAFATFGETFDPEHPEPAIGSLLNTLSLGPLDSKVNPEVSLYRAISQQPQIVRARTLTTRNAKQLDVLAQELWGSIGTSSQRRQATTGLFARWSLCSGENCTRRASAHIEPSAHDVSRYSWAVGLHGPKLLGDTRNPLGSPQCQVDQWGVSTRNLHLGASAALEFWKSLHAAYAGSCSLEAFPTKRLAACGRGPTT